MLKRFLISYTLLCMLPFIVLGILTANITGEVIADELGAAAEMSLDESMRVLDDVVSEVRQLALSVSTDEQVQRCLSRLEREQDPAAREEAYQALSTAMSRYQYYGKTGMRSHLAIASNVASDQEVDVSFVSAVQPDCGEAWYLAAAQNPKQFHWTNETSFSATFLRQSKMIYSEETWLPSGAVVITDVTTETLRGLTMPESRISGRLYLVADNGAIIYPYHNYDRLPQEILTAQESGVYELEEKNVIVKRMAFPGWNVIRVVELSDIHAQTSRIRWTIMGTAIVFMLLSLLAAVYFATHISRPVARLARKLQHTRVGKLTPVKPETRCYGEVAELYENFNYMIDRLNYQIERTYVSQVNQKDAELRALQAQINPHFLYNTLDSINWLALRYKAYDISRMVIALSDMLRFSLNKGKNTILVQDELRQVDSYITLQKVRYSDRFTVEYDVEEALKHKRIIKMLLQPIVENAIVHGFEEGEEAETGGVIRISIHSRGDQLAFEVCNNGKLIDLNRMRQRLTGEDGEPQRGYGIRNVNERLKGRYGPQYGLEYSIRGEWTVASFVIPEEESEYAESHDR